jgi:signal transduction histidine kinase
MRRSLSYALGVALAGALATLIGHGPHAGLIVLGILAPVGAVTVVVAYQVTRISGLRRQFAAMAVLIVAQLALVVALMAAAMFVEGSDAFFTVVAAAFSAALGLWAGRMVERTALERVEAEERARRDLVAAVSHDLRTPITSLRLLAEAVRDDLVDGEQRAEYLRRMSTHVNALSSLIDDLFELTRLEAGDIRWGLERVAIAEIVDETVEAMRADADAAVVRVATELPSATTWARTNPEQLQRVLFNLLQNAIRHTPPDGSVVVRAEPRERDVEIEVADSGAGIPADERERVFEPFVQGRGRAVAGDASAGLGLAIARAIVEAHGGRIWVAEGGATDAGTRVRFSLPRG